MTKSASTPWSKGRFGLGLKPMVLFGAMYEDPRIDLEALGDARKVLCVASSGDTAIALALAGHSVTAVDINPAQLAYAQRRLKGESYERGKAEQLMAVGRNLLRPFGWNKRRLRDFCAMADVDAQVREWNALTSGVAGKAVRALFSPTKLRVGYNSDFVDVAGDGFADRLFETIGAALAKTPNATNPYVAMLFLGSPPPGRTKFPDPAPELLCVEIIEHLESCEPGTYDGVTLSNILDGAPAEFGDRLGVALRRVVVPGSPIILRTFKPTTDVIERERASRDSSLIWSGIRVVSVEEF